MGRTRLGSLRLGTRLLSAFAILLYVTAALPPCEEPERLRASSMSFHAMPPSSQVEIEGSVPLTPRRTRTNATRDDHAHHHSQRDASEGEGSHSHQSTFPRSDARASSSRHASHRDSKAADAPIRSESAQTRAPGPAATQLAFTAPCACGCGDTRAAVGGGASRLGAVVPGQFVTRLLSPPPAGAARVEPSRFVGEVLEIDPIPI